MRVASGTTRVPNISNVLCTYFYADLNEKWTSVLIEYKTYFT